MKRAASILSAAALLAALTACGSGAAPGISTPSTGVVTFSPTPEPPDPLAPTPSDAPTYDPAPTTKATTAPLN